MGVRFVRRSDRSFHPDGPDEAHLETAIGYQLGLKSPLGHGSWFRRSAVVGAEVQWLHSRDRDRVRIAITPGLELKRPGNQRLLLQVSLGVGVFGAGAGTVYPGVAVGYRW
jgi:hypothetical protein